MPVRPQRRPFGQHTNRSRKKMRMIKSLRRRVRMKVFSKGWCKVEKLFASAFAMTMMMTMTMTQLSAWKAAILHRNKKSLLWSTKRQKIRCQTEKGL